MDWFHKKKVLIEKRENTIILFYVLHGDGFEFDINLLDYSSQEIRPELLEKVHPDLYEEITR